MGRVALIDLPATAPQDPPSSQVGSSHSILHESSSKHLTEEVTPPVKETKDNTKKRYMGGGRGGSQQGQVGSMLSFLVQGPSGYMS